MAQRQLVLIQLCPDIDCEKLMKAKTLAQVEKQCSRFSKSTEEDLTKRLFVYQQGHNDTWEAKPKIKKIYKHHLKVQEPTVTCSQVKKKIKMRSLKQINE